MFDKLLFIQELVEKSWDYYDEYIMESDRDILVKEAALEDWREAYFSDLVQRYQGTCDYLVSKDETFLEDFDMHQQLDDELFNCEQCGWWYEIAEMGDSDDGSLVCENCLEYN